MRTEFSRPVTSTKVPVSAWIPLARDPVFPRDDTYHVSGALRRLGMQLAGQNSAIGSSPTPPLTGGRLGERTERPAPRPPGSFVTESCSSLAEHLAEHGTKHRRLTCTFANT
jgi:hypothetical protein